MAHAAAPPPAQEAASLIGDPETPADEKREIGKLAVWSVTSAKPDNGVEMLRDNSNDTYWQSDGAQPHLVSLQFQQKERILEVALYLDYKLDESYTPRQVVVRAGNSFHDARDIRAIELLEPTGWFFINLKQGTGGDCLRAYFLQISILANHQNGRDCHVRQIRVFGPRRDPLQLPTQPLQFTSQEFREFVSVR